MSVFKRIFCKHNWKFDEPDPSVDAISWEGAKRGCYCPKCSAIDFRVPPIEKKQVHKFPSDMNILEVDTVNRLLELTKYGYEFIDICVRKDEKEHWFQGDFLARIKNNP